MESYNNILKTLIGRPELKAHIDNPFPLVGEVVNVSVKSRWVDSHAYTLNDGADTIEVDKVSLKGESSYPLLVAEAGQLEQLISALNPIGETSTSRPMYAMTNKEEPYFDVFVSKEIIRNDGETTNIILSTYNGFTINGADILISVFMENGDTSIKSFSLTAGNATNIVSPDISLENRGIYDIVVQVTKNGVSRKKRINKLITVTPKLSTRSEAIEYLCPDSKKVQGHTIDGSAYPVGSTIVLKYNPGYGDKYPIRMRFENFKGTWENPYIITFDESVPFEINWFGYYGIFVGNCKHIVFDGRGYQNISKGIKIKNMPEFANMGFQAGNLSSEIETFEIDIDGCDFACMCIKTDPDKNNPATWYGNFEMNRLLVHHCIFQNSIGEGNYLGHYSMSTYADVNSQGISVTYRAHHLYDCRVYRNKYSNNGYDALQFNNAENVELCYNEIHSAGYKLEVDQASGMSLGISGKIYNNRISNHNGPAIQFGVLGKTEIFNNIMGIGDRSYGGFTLLANMDTPEQNPSNQGYNDIPILIHNNVICSSNVNTLNARNTAQHKGIIYADNLCVSKKGQLMGGQSPETVATWLANAKNNISVQMFPINSDNLDNQFKIADSESVDFRLAFNSPLINTGCGDYFVTDIDGYYNFYGSTYPVGPHQGIFKNPTVDEQFRILSMIFDGEPDKTSIVTDSVSISWTNYGTSEVVAYMISEDVNMSQSSWINYEVGDTVTYAFEGAKGVKVLHLKLKNQLGEISEIYSKNIVLKAKKATICINATTNPTPQYNAQTGLTYVRIKGMNGVAKSFYDNTGVLMGTISKPTDYATAYFGDGAITGNDSGMYPDVVLKNNEQSNVNNNTTINGNPILFNISIEPGVYNIGIFSNSNLAFTDMAVINTVTRLFKYSANGIEADAIKIKDNTDTLVTLENVVVGSDGLLTLTAYWDESVLFAVSKFNFYGAVNAIEIQEV